MVNHLSPPEHRHSCPFCNNPIGPDDKFCEVCGMPVIETPVCSKCGALFMGPVRTCESCGAPAIPYEVPEGGEPAEEESGSDMQDVPGTGEDQVPEEVYGEYEGPLPEEAGEEEDRADYEDGGELAGPEKELTEEPADEELPREHRARPSRPAKEIPEPDTEDLLDTFGREYDDRATLESSRHQKPPRHDPGEREPAPRTASPVRASTGTVDDVLFMAPKNREEARPEKQPKNRMRIFGAILLVAALAAGIWFIGLPLYSTFTAEETPPFKGTVEVIALPEETVTATPAPAWTVSTASGIKSLIPIPTQQLPAGQKIYFRVDKNPITAKIAIIFSGSAGHESLKSAEVTVTHPTGAVASGIILPLKGISEISLDGSKGTDRVEIIARMSSGESYRVYDALVPYTGD
ncbi:MAG: zinc ribbon domain-containing protein [Methanomicrobiales archaeon]|nr:zinc ribbon domain-containing protein [Methanomicrobiales archaeon]